MSEAAERLRARTKQFALRIIKLVRSLPRSLESQTLGKQVLRSATSVAANYRAACRARSKAEFISRIGIVLEEADESQFWLELIGDSEIVPRKRLAELLKEATELTAIFTASRETAKGSRKNLQVSRGEENGR